MKKIKLTLFCYLNTYFCFVKYINFILLFCLSILAFQVKAQQGRLNQVSSKHTWIKDQNKWIAIVGVYEQNGNTLSADSSIMFEDDIKRQFFDGFNNVVITQPGTTIYANRLHYDALTQIAVLTGNVRLVSENSILTTNHLTYNLNSKTGVYTGGGRIVSQADTITSQRAYYFDKRGDAFFRGKVIVRTPQVKVYTDSMNYNQITKDTYFFGPTDIKGNNKENLYTERGVYNTVTGIAKFSKNNLYNEGSKFLSGDSLYYNRDVGIGEAYRNVVFVDTLDKFYAYGNKGLYTQSDESILMTEKPYIVTVIKNDTTKTDTIQSSPALTPEKTESKKKKDKAEETKAEIKVAEKDNMPISQDSSANSIALLPKKESLVDSVYMTADTLYSKVILAKDYKPLNLNLDRNGGAIMVQDDVNYGDDEDDDDLKIITGSDSISIEGNTITIDSVQQNLPKKKVIDSVKNNAKKSKMIAKKEDPFLISQTLKADSVLRKNTVIPIVNQKDSIMSKALKTAQTQDTAKVTKDSLHQNNTADTAKTRIVKAYYNVRMFKSDLQAVADSVYYGMQDSMFRFMGRPMIWSQGSQISADTIYMQIVNQQMDNALLKDNAFMVNVVLDSVKFNQLKGRKITAFFANNSIDRLYVDGNAENLVFATNDKTKIITEMFHDRGGRIKVKMDNKEIIDYTTIQKVDQKVYPFAQVNQENEILPGFIWRPQDRPLSKEDLLNRKRELPKNEEPKDDKEKKGTSPSEKSKELDEEEIKQ